ncbi:flagellar hook-basal body complex protein FliE [Kineococcus rhizosphaerae]|uniref:Flagellar hook-basal body complex protein FliE n=1 Tax=Kineococcus rhizosphaerae TaxID=559628 RepID=A0A2T0RAQ6_9ACTN|nr:flagellar hook-basal body complex protein FliE [Kineococcus rhizosphaerae]PRY18220.1 flagellar hook-basal body complex protein FliE [Kineococcus rhizosphaerae]
MSIESIGGVGDVASSLGTLAAGYGQGIADTDNAQMTSAIGGGSGTTYTGSVSALAPTGISGIGTNTSVDGSSGTDFASLLSGGIDKLQGLQSTSDDLAVKAATGDLTNVHDYMIASNEAQLATQLTVAVRNKAVDAFNEIMRMQV